MATRSGPIALPQRRELHLDAVSTTCGSGWVDDKHANPEVDG